MEKKPPKDFSTAFHDLHEAVAELKAAIADTPPWRMLRRFAESHPLFALTAFPVTMLGLSGVYLWLGEPLSAIVTTVMALVVPLSLRRA